MKESTRDNLLLVGKTILIALGGLLAVAALVELSVDGWSLQAAAVLAVGLLLVVPPVAFAFRDALRAGRRSS